MGNISHSDHHSIFMDRALQLAERGLGRTAPNPPVGCVLVKNEKVIGEGFHHRSGGLHAEIHALQQCRESPVGATAYVTLEPCTIFGKTPPCARALVNAGITRLVVAQLDPNPAVHGRGIQFAESHGIEVIHGIQEEKAARQIRGFRRWISSGKPYVIAKVAQSSNRCLGLDNQSQSWLTGNEAGVYVHGLRDKVDAVMIGSQTALVDDPQLTVRAIEGNNPKRVVVDTHRRLPENLRLFRDAQAETIVLTSEDHNCAHRTSFYQVIPVQMKDGCLSPVKILEGLGKEGVTSLLIEGGAALLFSFAQENLIDEVHQLTAPMVLEHAELENPLILDDSWVITAEEKLGNDELIVAHRKGENVYGNC